MFKKLTLLLSIFAVSNFAFANTRPERSTAEKAHEEGYAEAHEEHDKGHEHHVEESASK